jgi:hypothetical protein
MCDKSITTVTVPKVVEFELIPSDDIQTHLLSIGFSYNGSSLIKKTETHTIVYDIEVGVLSIFRMNAGTIVLNPFGDLDKTIRFISKYSI